MNVSYSNSLHLSGVSEFLLNSFNISGNLGDRAVQLLRNISLQMHTNKSIATAVIVSTNVLFFSVMNAMITYLSKRFTLLDHQQKLANSLIIGGSTLIFNVRLSKMTQYPLNPFLITAITVTAIAVHLFFIQKIKTQLTLNDPQPLVAPLQTPLTASLTAPLTPPLSAALWVPLPAPLTTSFKSDPAAPVTKQIVMTPSIQKSLDVMIEICGGQDRYNALPILNLKGPSLDYINNITPEMMTYPVMKFMSAGRIGIAIRGKRVSAKPPKVTVQAIHQRDSSDPRWVVVDNDLVPSVGAGLVFIENGVLQKKETAEHLTQLITTGEVEVSHMLYTGKIELV